MPPPTDHYQEIALQALDRVLDWQRTNGETKLEHLQYEPGRGVRQLDPSAQQHRFTDMKRFSNSMGRRTEVIGRDWWHLAPFLKRQKFVARRTLRFETQAETEYHRSGLMIDVHPVPGSFRSSERVDKTVSLNPTRTAAFLDSWKSCRVLRESLVFSRFSTSTPLTSISELSEKISKPTSWTTRRSRSCLPRTRQRERQIPCRSHRKRAINICWTILIYTVRSSWTPQMARINSSSQPSFREKLTRNAFGTC